MKQSINCRPRKTLERMIAPNNVGYNITSIRELYTGDEWEGSKYCPESQKWRIKTTYLNQKLALG